MRAAGHTLTREIREFSGRIARFGPEELKHHLRLRTERIERLLERTLRTRRLSYRLEVVRGNVSSEILRRSEEADLVSLGGRGRTPRGTERLGSTARRLLRESTRPLLIAGEKTRIGPHVIVVYDGTSPGESTLRIATDIADREEDYPLRVVLIEPDPDVRANHREKFRESTESMRSPLLFEEFDTLPFERLARLTQTAQCGLLVLPAEFLREPREDTGILFRTVRCPIILVP